MTALAHNPDGETPYAIGAAVSCTDAECGTLLRVIIDPVARRLLHLVVGPGPDRSPVRLVPVSLVESASPDTIKLACDSRRFGLLEPAEEAEFLPATRGDLGYATDRIGWLPYYPLGPLAVGPLPGEPVVYDRVPAGEVAIRRGDAVHAVDGDIGRVQGLVVDARDESVTHVLLAEGHLWGKKDVAIPVGAVTEANGDGIRLDLTKEQVRDLPPVVIGALG
jgi:hypothetical protein